MGWGRGLNKNGERKLYVPDCRYHLRSTHKVLHHAFPTRINWWAKTSPSSLNLLVYGYLITATGKVADIPSKPHYQLYSSQVFCCLQFQIRKSHHQWSRRHQKAHLDSLKIKITGFKTLAKTLKAHTLLTQSRPVLTRYPWINHVYACLRC